MFTKASSEDQLISMGELTTKQHYVWDLLGAAIVVFIALKITAPKASPNAEPLP